MSEVSNGVPHPTDASFAEEWGAAWSEDPERLAEFYTPDAVYTDVAMQTTVRGRDGIAGYYRHMTKFIGDSRIVFDSDVHACDARLTAGWTWSGTATGQLRLPDGRLLDLAGQRLSSRGVAVCRYGPDGLLISHLDYWDLATMLAPAGVRLA